MRIHLPCEILGKEHEGPPLILIPGLGSDSRTWSGARLQLAKHFRVIALNNRGVGISDDLPNAYSVFDMMTDVVKQMDALKIEKAYVLGHSLGGAVAQLLAIHHPGRVKKLILLSTRAYFSQKSAFFYDMMVKFLDLGIPRELFIQNLFLSLFGFTFFEDEVKAKNLIKISAALPQNITPHNYYLQIQATLQHDTRAQLNKIKAPTHVILGAEDVLCLPRYSFELVAAIPHATLSIIEHAGHMAFIETEELFVAKVIAFLEDFTDAA